MIWNAVLCLLCMAACFYYTTKTLERGEVAIGACFVTMFVVFGWLGASFAALHS